MIQSKPIASLSLDLDNQWSYMKTHGDAGWESFPSYLDIVVPRVLAFLAERNIKITFFIVGQDAALAKNHEANHTQTVYGDDYFNSGGAGYPDYLGESKLLRAHGKRYANLLKRYIDTGTMLDVGAAAGFILQGFIDCGWKGCGI